MELSLVIPAYNEANRIGKTVKAFLSYFKDRFEVFELIIVCDGCKDRTSSIAKGYAIKEERIKVLEFSDRLGKGGGIIEGFKVATGDLIGFVDADLAVSPTEFGKLVTELKNDVEGAIASRKIKNAIISVKQPFKRRFAGAIFNLMVRSIFGLGIKDTQCGGKCFKRKAIDAVLQDIKCRAYLFDVEVLYKMKRRGFKIVEVPINWKHKEEAKFDYIKDGIKMGLDLLKLRFGR